MNHAKLKPKSIAITAHPTVEQAFQIAKEISEFLEKKGIHNAYGLLYDKSLIQRVKAREFDILIALGGDGTMLRAGHLCAPLGLPIMGINLGRFGFLLETRRDEWKEAVRKILKKEYWLERRMMLCAEHWRTGEKLGSWDVLNEVVVSRGQIVRPVHLTTYVDNRFLTTYVADGLIASTPTGSTAYALAAGGPILPPESRNILIVPVAPHLSVDRAIVLSEGSFVSITVHTEHQAIMSVDGQVPIELSDGDEVKVRANDYNVEFVRIQDPGYFYRNLTPHMNRNPSTTNYAS
ncbi:MAG TPA: NAD(+)/NADH kinase [Anaerolineae bacterium]|nr:NAD(+)/NADH kinase [Anaerolineae bacterium]